MRVPLVLLCAALAACTATSKQPQKPMPREPLDRHSYANFEVARVKNIDLDLEVLFERKVIRGTAVLDLERTGPNPVQLDTRDLKIEAVTVGVNDVPYELAPADRILGSKLTIHLPEGSHQVSIRYETAPGATALQWLTPSQTAGKKEPFLFTQSQAIHARSWIPCQDSPAVRQTFRARVRIPENLTAVMGAKAVSSQPGEYRFQMRLPIPSYLIALAVGDLKFQTMGTRTGVWAEPSVLEAAAKEFEDTEKMLEAAESLYGPYRWERYDILVLPPSFPFGGMENPMLTFATPTIIAGDKSLVSLISHELAHSWSGNLVTNASWADFWLNEGFTVYVERRIQEKVYGARRAGMEAVLGRSDLERDLEKLPPPEQILHIDLTGRDPDDGATDVPYEKGALFLRTLEEAFGRQKLDEFLRAYFDRFQFQSITTAAFVNYLRGSLLDAHPEIAAKIPLDEWLYKPGVPASAFTPQSDAFTTVSTCAHEWSEGKAVPGTITKEWSTQEWLHFLRALPASLSARQMAQLDHAYQFTATGNFEVLNEWLTLAVRHDYRKAFPRLRKFLAGVGRRKYLKPLYEELVKTPEGKAFARQVYVAARPSYHPIAISTIDQIVQR
jgi:leukotriene A-4 hydrolase/aminopeptidase